MNTLAIMILWTLGLTPAWVNIVGTVLLGLRIIINIRNALVETIAERS